MSFHYEFTQSIKSVLSKMSLSSSGVETKKALPKLIVVDDHTPQEDGSVWLEKWTFEAHIGEMRRVGAV